MLIYLNLLKIRFDLRKNILNKKVKINKNKIYKKQKN